MDETVHTFESLIRRGKKSPLAKKDTKKAQIIKEGLSDDPCNPLRGIEALIDIILDYVDFPSSLIYGCCCFFLQFIQQYCEEAAKVSQSSLSNSPLMIKMEKDIWKLLVEKYKDESHSKVQFACLHNLRFFVNWDSGDIYISSFCYWGPCTWLPEMHIGNVWNEYIASPLDSISISAVNCDTTGKNLFVCDCCANDTGAAKASEMFRKQKRFRISFTICHVYAQKKYKKQKKSTKKVLFLRKRNVILA